MAADYGEFQGGVELRWVIAVVEGTGCGSEGSMLIREADEGAADKRGCTCIS
jgi:hypothetical protein